MTNNDILKRLRYAFDFSNDQATKLFATDPSSSSEVSKTDFLAFLEHKDELEKGVLGDDQLACFLDGLIVSRRGLRENADQAPIQREADFRLSKNDVLKKLRIALNYREQQMLETLKLGGSEISKGELGAFFRKPNHRHYRACGNQVLRNFIKGLTIQLRG